MLASRCKRWIAPACRCVIVCSLELQGGQYMMCDGCQERDETCRDDTCVCVK